MKVILLMNLIDVMEESLLKDLQMPSEKKMQEKAIPMQ